MLKFIDIHQIYWPQIGSFVIEIFIEKSIKSKIRPKKHYSNDKHMEMEIDEVIQGSIGFPQVRSAMKIREDRK